MSWRIIYIVMVWLASYSGGDKFFPKPSLTQHKSIVLKLECQPPEDTTSWQDVHDIRVFVCLRAPHFDTCVNHTVAIMTSAMTRSMTTPTRGSVLPSIASVTFAGTWTLAGYPTLTVQTPFSSQNYGVYYCTSEYSSSEGIRKYSAGLSVDDSSNTRRLPLKRDRFEVQILKAHAVNVTWRPPDDSEFLEGRVTRSFVDREGKVTTAPRSLFMATTTRDFVFDNAGVLLTQFQTPSSTGQNYSMIVYVDSQMRTQFYRYSCNVLYHTCVGPDALFCECRHEEKVPSNAASAGLSQAGVAAICLALLIVVSAVLVIVLFILLRRGTLPRIKALLDAPTANEDRNTDSVTQPESIQQAATQPGPEAQAKPDKELKVILPPKKPHGNKSDRLTQDIHHRDKDSDWRDRRQKNEPPNPPSDDAPSSQEETEEQGATGGENTPLMCEESDNAQPGTEKKSALHPSPEQAARISKALGGGGARPKDTHQNPAASLSSQPHMDTSELIPPSTSRYSDLNPLQAEESTPKQQQPKMEFDYGMRGADNATKDVSLRPPSKSALQMRNLSGTAETDLQKSPTLHREQSGC